MKHPVTIMSFLPFSDKYAHVVMLVVVVLIVFSLGLMVRSMLSVATSGGGEIPSRGQIIFEGIIRYLTNLGESIMGKEGLVYMPLIFGIGFYVAISNLLGMVPGFLPPTMNMNTTAAPAVCVFLFYQTLGFRRHGLGYIKHFMGPVMVLAPLMLVIELIGHFARPLSLTMRLFGNISGEEIVVAVLFSLVPFLVPLPMYFLLAFSGLLQAFVFMLLTMVYISGALEEAH